LSNRRKNYVWRTQSEQLCILKLIGRIGAAVCNCNESIASRTAQALTFLSKIFEQFAAIRCAVAVTMTEIGKKSRYQNAPSSRRASMVSRSTDGNRMLPQTHTLQLCRRLADNGQPALPSLTNNTDVGGAHREDLAAT